MVDPFAPAPVTTRFLMSANSFYTEFDYTTFEGFQRGGAGDDRTPFMLDRDRILYASAFRRLQAKTQVFLSGEYDFYRTRLTHSLEVAQIGRSLCHSLKRSSPFLSDERYIDPDLVEGICLAHDIGHPPFGHAGERSLHDLMREGYGGFEGNAQTLRILTQTLYKRTVGRVGMNPSRGLLDGVMKYKALFSETPDASNKFIYDINRPALVFFAGGEENLARLPIGRARNTEKSVECQIMDWADDTAYSLNDMLDGINAGFLREDTLRKWAERQPELDDRTSKLLDWLLDTIHQGKSEARFSRKIGDYLRACQLTERDHPLATLTNRYHYQIEIEPEIRAESEIFKRIACDLVFRSPPLQQLEHKGREILSRLFHAFLDNYSGRANATGFSLVPGDFDRGIREAEDEAARARLICDYLAGMTDSFAVRVHRRLFDPTYNVITDL